LSILKFNIKVLSIYIVLFAFLISLFYLFKISGSDFTNLRADFYSSRGVFSNTILNTLYASFLMPLLIISIIFLFNYYDYNSKFIYLALLTLLFDAIIRQGRFQLLYILFFLIYFRRHLKIKSKYLILATFIIIVLAFYTLYTRFLINDAAISTLSDFFNPQVVWNSTINYQVYGYIFLDKLVDKINPFGRFYEMNLFSQFYYLLNTIFLTKIGLFLHYPWEEHNLILDQGMYADVFDFDFNAFSTNFYPIYLDYGFLGILFYGIFSGFLTALQTNNRFIRSIKALNIFILIFGLYQPIIVFLIGFIFLILALYIIFQFLFKILLLNKNE
jgi:hypothetical protein